MSGSFLLPNPHYSRTLVVNKLIIHLTVVDIAFSEFGSDGVSMVAIASMVSEESVNSAQYFHPLFEILNNMT